MGSPNLKAYTYGGWAFLLVSLLARGQAASPQEPAPGDVASVLRQAREEIRSFEKAGGKREDTNHPVGKWAEVLWAFRKKSPGAADATKATSEAIHILIHADRFQEAHERADRVPPNDPAWAPMAEVLFEAASLQKDFGYFFRKLDSVLPGAADAEVRAALQLGLGRAWRAQKDPEKAKEAFQAAIKSSWNSTWGKQAEAALYELLHLSPGQPAPQFSAPAMSGSRISLSDYRGKPVVLVFWSTT